MRRRSLTSLILALPILGLLGAVPAQADYDGSRNQGYWGGYYGGDGNRYNRLPGGSWVNSCKNVEVKGNSLRADCRRHDGSWNRAGLDFTRCPAGLRNNGGRLECESRGWSNWGNNGWPNNGWGNNGWSNNGWGNNNWARYNNGRVPNGSFRDSCRQERVDGYVLRAKCRENDGDYRQAALDLRQCGGDIFNQNGKLRCRKN